MKDEQKSKTELLQELREARQINASLKVTISELERAEAVPPEGEAHFRQMFQRHSAIMLLIESQSGRIVDANKAATQFYGHSQAELTQMNIGDINTLSAEGVARCRREASAATSSTFQFRHRLRSGEVRSVEAHSMPIKFADQELLFSIIADVTERVEAEEELLKKQRFLTRAQEIGAIGTWELNVRKNELLWTDENYRIFGLPLGTNLTYETFLGCVHPEDRDYVDTEWKAAFQKKAYDIEHRLLVDGKVKWVREKAELEFDDRDECVSGIGFSQDITYRKQGEAEREQLKEQLYQSQKMEAIGQLAGGVAHDFNNVLCVITGNVDMALEDVSSEEPLRESLLDVKKAAARAADLTRQLLAFSRKQVIDPKVIDLSVVVEQLHYMLVRLIGENIVLRTMPQKEIGRVRADPSQIEQIVINLAVNARDAMPDGGELYIETADVVLDELYCSHNASATPGAYVVLTVRDTGCGMSDEVRDRIFEPFYTTKQLGQGTGLGLASVFGIVEQSGGRIEVISSPGEGASFKVYFPRVFDQAESPAALRDSTPRTGTETVLVVEDEEMVRTLAVKLLQSSGYNVLASESGVDALALAERYEGPIDLLLTDVVMPHMNGRELSIRLAEICAGVKVLFTSGYSQSVIAHHGVLDEGLEFIAKPYTNHQLSVRVREVLDSD